MDEEKERKFESEGMSWDNGEIPECSYCGEDIDNCEGELHETPFSDLCCMDENCMLSLAEDCLTNQVEEVTEEEDDEDGK